MNHFLHLLFFLITYHLISAQNTEALKYIHCGWLIDVERMQILEKRTIVVRADTIQSVLDGWQNPRLGEQLIDLKKYYVLPGLIDLHVHIESESNAKSYLEKYTLNEADRAYWAHLHGQKTLSAGFTTIRDLGGTGVNVAYRNAINEGIVSGPRIYTAEKSIATTGGHADPTNGSNKLFMGDPGPDQGVINSPQEARKAVRQRYKNGADLIKITATGGVLSVAASGLNPQFFQDELDEVVKAAHDYGFHVAAHAHGTEGMKRAVIAGARTIEHGTFMDDEVIQLMKEKGTYYVPTITAGKFVASKAKIAGFYPKMIAIKAEAIGPQIQQSFAKAYKAGVKIAFGTDSGVSYHGDNADEFIYMVEAGMPPLEAIQSATLTASEVLDLQHKLGSISPGKWADIIAVPRDPSQDISALKEVIFVMKEGKIFKNVP